MQDDSVEVAGEAGESIAGDLMREVAGLIEDLKRHDRRRDALLTYKGAAELLGTSERKVKRYVRSGELPVIDLDGSVRIHPKALEAFIRERVRRGSR